MVSKGYGEEEEDEGGLLFHMSPQICAFLKATTHHRGLRDHDKDKEEEREDIEKEQEEERERKGIEKEKDLVGYRVVRDRWLQMDPHARPSFKDLLASTAIAFPSPKPREKDCSSGACERNWSSYSLIHTKIRNRLKTTQLEKLVYCRANLRLLRKLKTLAGPMQSAELQARLEKLQDTVDRRAYGELVKDVVASKEEQEYFSSYKEQIGFGLHVIVAMFTGYLIGYAFFRSQFPNNMGLHAAGGLLGLVLVMLVESLLFIIQFSKIEKKTSKHGKKKTEMDTRFNSQGTRSSMRKVGKHSWATSTGQQ